VGYQPPHTDEGDAGEIDVLACLEGVLLLLEVKSGFIRSNGHEVWLHRTNTLRKAARQLKRKGPVVLPALLADSDLRYALGLAISDPLPDLHTWVVDTSIELDGEVVDDALVISREVLDVALRDELHYLRAFDQEAEEEEAIATLYPDGFSAQAFVRIIERNEVWRGLL
jgi:hypothetical protein